jgi:hypothetical protein
MDIILWLVVLALFVLSFVALVYPVLPSVTAVWAGFLIYQFLINPNELTIFFWVSMIILTIILVLADVFASSLSVKKFGGSKAGERVAAISVIIGSFIYPPFGIIILPFVAVLITELIIDRDFKNALISSIGSLIGFLTGRVAEGLIQIVMILWFFLTIWF